MQKLGLVFIVVSFLPWVAIPLILPFLPLSVAQKAFLVPLLLGIAEVMFWLGLLLAGKEVAQRFKCYLNPRRFGSWLKRNLRKKKKICAFRY